MIRTVQRTYRDGTISRSVAILEELFGEFVGDCE
jgi:hypothetical protein